MKSQYVPSTSSAVGVLRDFTRLHVPAVPFTVQVPLPCDPEASPFCAADAIPGVKARIEIDALASSADDQRRMERPIDNCGPFLLGRFSNRTCPKCAGDQTYAMRQPLDVFILTGPWSLPPFSGRNSRRTQDFLELMAIFIA